MSLHVALRFAVIASLLALTGCLTAPPIPPLTADTPEFTVETFFSGRTSAEAELTMRGQAPRKLTWQGVGQREPDGTFRLEQTLTWDNGAVEKRTWRLRRVDEHHYTGTLNAASGEVSGEAHGNVLHLNYLLRSPAIYMDQWLYLRKDGRTIDNQSTVTVLGIPWGRLSEQIMRADGDSARP